MPTSYNNHKPLVLEDGVQKGLPANDTISGVTHIDIDTNPPVDDGNLWRDSTNDFVKVWDPKTSTWKKLQFIDDGTAEGQTLRWDNVLKEWKVNSYLTTYASVVRINDSTQTVATPGQLTIKAAAASGGDALLIRNNTNTLDKFFVQYNGHTGGDIDLTGGTVRQWEMKPLTNGMALLMSRGSALSAHNYLHTGNITLLGYSNTAGFVSYGSRLGHLFFFDTPQSGAVPVSNTIGVALNSNNTGALAGRVGVHVGDLTIPIGSKGIYVRQVSVMGGTSMQVDNAATWGTGGFAIGHDINVTGASTTANIGIDLDVSGSLGSDVSIVSRTQAFSILGDTYGFANSLLTIKKTVGATYAGINCAGNIATPNITFADGDTTPSVADSNIFSTANTGATSITTFDDGINGQMITVLVTDINTTFVDGVTLNLNGAVNYNPPADTVISFMHNGTNWYEISRSQN